MSCLCLAPLLTSISGSVIGPLSGRANCSATLEFMRSVEQSDARNRSCLSCYFLLSFQLQCGTICSDRVALVAYAKSHLQMQVNNYKYGNYLVGLVQ